MTSRQKLQLEQSEKRQKINEFLAVDDLTDEQRNELEALTKRMQSLEIELRAAIVVEGEEEGAARGQFGNGDGAPSELRNLLDATTLSDYLGAASAGGAVEGRAAELNAALEVPLAGARGGVPCRGMCSKCGLLRALAKMTARRCNARSFNAFSGRVIFDALGVRMDSVPVGRSEWPLISGGVAPAQAKEDRRCGGCRGCGDVHTATLKPKRLTGVYEYTHEEGASVTDIEQALRRDLGDAVKAKMSDLIINGAAPTNQNPHNVEGFLTKIAAPGDAGATAVFADYAGAHAAVIDGLHAEMEDEVSSVIGVDTYRHAASVYQAGSGESGIRSAFPTLYVVPGFELHPECHKRRSVETQHVPPWRARTAAEICAAILLQPCGVVGLRS